MPKNGAHLTQRLTALWDGALDGLVVIDPACMIEDANPAFCTLVGYQLDELRRMHIWDIDESGEELTRERLARVASEGLLGYTSLLRSADGRRLEVRFNATFLEDEGGLFFAWVRDETEHRVTRRQLTDSEQRFTMAMSAARNAVWDWNIREGTLDLSAEWKAQLGYEQDELPSAFETWVDLLHPEERVAMTSKVNEFLENPSDTFEARFRLRHNKGHYVSILSRATPQLDEHGEIVRLLGVHIDLTEVFQGEQMLRTQWQTLLRILDAIPEIVFVSDQRSGEILHFNRELTRRVGLRPEKKTCGEIFEEAFEASLRGSAADKTGDPATQIEVSDAKLGGDFAVTNRPITWPDGRPATLHVAIDITKRKESERSLRESEARLRATFDQAAVGIAHVAPDGSWLRVNQRCCDILGYPREVLLGMTSQDITHPEDLNKDLDLLGKLLRGEIDTYSMQKRYFHKEGDTVWTNLTVSVAREESGEPRYCISVIEDISASKRAEAELSALASELRQSNDELESFASVVSHDLQEPLRVVAGYLQLVETRNASLLDESSRDYIQRAIAGARRMQGLIQDLLALARVGSRAIEPQRFDLGILVTRVCEDLAPVIEESEAHIELGPLPQVSADPGQVRQLLQNLIANAIKFRRGPGPRIKVRTEEAPREWILVVEDDGIGIDERHRERIFEVFGRLHARKEFEGTGIGLAICRRIADRHGGRIWVESQAGEGSVFRVSFPRSLRAKDRI